MFASPICRRRWRDNAFPFRRIRRRGGNPANIAARGASNQTQRAILGAGEIRYVGLMLRA
jgi:hypothetical protein